MNCTDADGLTKEKKSLTNNKIERSDLFLFRCCVNKQTLFSIVF